MSKQKPRRINYRINYCSSEDPEGPVSELVLQSSEARGWITKRFAPYPQTIVIQLLQLSLVNNISFLSHQSKICTKIEIQGKQDQSQNWVRLGYTTLESGANTNYQSRQLRNVSLGGRLLLLLKFTFHQNYANHINIFNQIGIIALLVYGEKATVERNMVRNKEGNVVASLNELDRETILKLKNLQQLKNEAVEQHRFEDAKDFKEQIETLQGNLKALIVLQRQKKQAIKREDYDEAKDIVQRMKRLRGPMVFLQPTNNNYDNKSIDFTPKKRVASSKADYNDPEVQQKDHFYKVPSRRSENRGKSSFDINPMRYNKSTSIPFDEIKIKARDRYPIEEELERDAVNLNKIKPLPPRSNANNRSFRKNIESNVEDEQMLSPRELPSLKKLEKLTPQQFDECSRYFPIFNEITFQYLLSRDHGYRQKGLKIINDILQKTEVGEKRLAQQFVSASIFVVKKLIDDNLLSLLIGVVDFFGMMMKKFRPNAIGQAAKNVRYILERMSDYLGHTSDKLREEVQDVLISLPVHQLTNRELCFEVLMDNPREKMPKITAGRLNMLAAIIEKYHVSIEVDDLIDFSKRYLEDRNSEVRSAAVNLIAKLSKQMGYDNLYDDLKNLKPQVIKLIQDKIESQGGVITKIEVNKSKSFKNIGQKQQNPNNHRKEEGKASNPEYICQYCKIFDKRLENDDFRDQHLYSNCKMITLCGQCSQAIEVSLLNNHLLAECQNHKYFKRCPKCREAIPTRQYNSHIKMKQCIAAKPPAQANRCPLCHEDILAGEEGWVKHLVQQGCPLNPRK